MAGRMGTAAAGVENTDLGGCRGTYCPALDTSISRLDPEGVSRVIGLPWEQACYLTTWEVVP